MCQQFFKVEGWENKFSILWKGPGWQPGLPRLGNDDFPEVTYPIQVYHPNISTELSVYTFIHFLYVLIQYSAVLKQSKVNEIFGNIFIICFALELFDFGFIFIFNYFTFYFNNIWCDFRSKVNDLF
jgi:alkylglycerol monooxygenase